MVATVDRVQIQKRIRYISRDMVGRFVDIVEDTVRFSNIDIRFEVSMPEFSPSKCPDGFVPVTITAPTEDAVRADLALTIPLDDWQC